MSLRVFSRFLHLQVLLILCGLPTGECETAPSFHKISDLIRPLWGEYDAITGTSSSTDQSTSFSPNTTNTQPNTILPTDKFTEAEVKELVSLSFTREQVFYELRRFNGDKTQATAALFAKSLKF